MAVNFPIPDYQEVETLAEMVSRVLLVYSSELGLENIDSAHQSSKSDSSDRLSPAAHERLGEAS